MNNIHADKFIQQGWECPKCGAILAPHQNYCPFCSRENYLSNYRKTEEERKRDTIDALERCKIDQSLFIKEEQQ